MSAPTFTPISLYYSETPGAQPTNTNLVKGELGINIYDGKLYYKDNTNTVQLLASKETSSNVTSVSVVSANGFAGTVANPTTTPAITLTTSATGILKGSSGALVAASPGVDYAPATSGSSILYANGSGGFSAVTIGSNLTFAGGTLSATGGGSSGVTSFNTRTGAVSLLSADVTSALGYTPAYANGSNASGTWGINISGSAASATTATTATNANALGGYASSSFALLSGATFSGTVTSTAWNMTSNTSMYYYSADQNIKWAIGGSTIMTVGPAGNFEIAGSLAYKVGGGSWTATSDQRLKDNVTPLSGALAKISALKPVSYTWKIDSQEPTVGFIAQDVEKVLPNAVSKLAPRDAQQQFIQDEVHSIGWQNDIFAYLVGAIQELKAEVDALKAAK